MKAFLRAADVLVLIMAALNPKTAEQWRQEEEARRFLAGDDATAPPASTHEHDGSQP